MRWMLLAASAAVAASLWLPGEAAQPPAAAGVGAGPDKITFAQYRDWRLAWNARRSRQIASELARPDLPAARRDRLSQVKSYYDWLAGLAAADRDGRFRARFERIDSDHDGTIDRAERAAWRAERRLLYRRSGAVRATAALRH
jgi:hypothetical protein